jgi:hypothetical protein
VQTLAKICLQLATRQLLHHFDRRSYCSLPYRTVDLHERKES